MTVSPQMELFKTEVLDEDMLVIRKGFFFEKSFEALSAQAQALYLFLYSHPDTTSVGLIFKTGVGVASERLRCSTEGRTMSDLDALEKKGWIWTPKDKTEPLILLPFYLSANPPQSRGALKQWLRQIKRIRCETLQKFFLARLFVLRSHWPDFLLEYLDKRIGEEVEAAFQAVQSGDYDEKAVSRPVIEHYNHVGHAPPLLKDEKEPGTPADRAPKKEPPIQWDHELGFINITQARLKRWKEAYPGVDVELKIKQLHEWLLAKGKRYKNWQMFLTRNLARECDRKGWHTESRPTGATPPPREIQRKEMPF